MAARKAGLIALFDVDGTLTAPRKVVTPKMLEFMQKLRKVVTVGIVGGSNLVKISEKLGISEYTLLKSYFSGTFRRMGITDAGTFLTPGKKRGDLKNLWTRGVPERPCPHVQDEHSQEFNEEK